MTDTTNPLDTSSVMRCYGLLAFGMLFCFFPNPFLGGLGGLSMIVGTVWAYRIRKAAADNPVLHSHGRWLIRSFWIVSLYMLIAILIWASIISSNADLSAMTELATAMEAGTANPAMIEGAIASYKQVNASLILWTSILCFAPLALLMLARFFKGYRLADKGEPVSNVTSWLL